MNFIPKLMGVFSRPKEKHTHYRTLEDIRYRVIALA